MNCDEITQTAVEHAIQYEKTYHGCAQCVVGGIMDAFELDAPATFRATTGLSGGMGVTGHTCGALTGGIIAIGLFVGRDRDNMGDPERLRWENFALVKELIERFQRVYGVLECHKVQERVVGVGVDFWNPEEAERFSHDLQGHVKCAEGVVGEVTRWTCELILGYLERVREDEY